MYSEFADIYDSLMKDVEYSEQLTNGAEIISDNAMGEINGDNKDKGNSY